MAEVDRVRFSGAGAGAIRRAITTCALGALSAMLIAALGAARAPRAHAAAMRTRATGGLSAARHPAVVLDEGVATRLAGGERLSIAGRVSAAPAGARMVLEVRSSSRWRIVAHARERGGRFTISWLPPASSTLSLRLALRAGGRVRALSSVVRLRTGRAPVYCRQAPKPSGVPAGDGWVVGGLYDSGGPAPGIFECSSAAYSIVALDEAGEVVKTVQVAGGRGYAIVLPAGSYELRSSDSCFSEEAVTVVAGRSVRADTICNIR